MGRCFSLAPLSAAQRGRIRAAGTLGGHVPGGRSSCSLCGSPGAALRSPLLRSGTKGDTWGAPPPASAASLCRSRDAAAEVALGSEIETQCPFDTGLCASHRARKWCIRQPCCVTNIFTTRPLKTAPSGCPLRVCGPGPGRGSGGPLPRGLSQAAVGVPSGALATSRLHPSLSQAPNMRGVPGPSTRTPSKPLQALTHHFPEGARPGRGCEGEGAGGEGWTGEGSVPRSVQACPCH